MGVEAVNPTAAPGGVPPPFEADGRAAGFEPTTPSLKRLEAPGGVREGDGVEERAFVDVELDSDGDGADPPG